MTRKQENPGPCQKGNQVSWLACQATLLGKITSLMKAAPIQKNKNLPIKCPCAKPGFHPSGSLLQGLLVLLGSLSSRSWCSWVCSPLFPGNAAIFILLQLLGFCSFLALVWLLSSPCTLCSFLADFWVLMLSPKSSITPLN